MKRIEKKIISFLLVAFLLVNIYPNTYLSTKVNAASTLTLSELKSKFPDGKYWNHYVSKESEAADLLDDYGNESFANTTTSHGCALHGSASTSYYVGKYDCNYFDGGWQCFGFARKLGYDAFGTRVSSWSETTSLSGLKAGDVIRYKTSTGEHSIFVIEVSGTTVKVGECNWRQSNSEGFCIIHWSRSVNLSSLTIIKRYIAPRELGGNPPNPSLTTDTRYSVPFKCRTISTSKVQCYNDAAKTSSPGYIYPEDDCVITAIYTNGLLKCDCPWSDGSTKTVYVDKSVFINSSMTPSTMTAPQYAVTYLRSDGGTSIGWIDPGDSITKVATSGNYTQIIYPASVGKRCAWVLTSALSTLPTVDYPTPFLCRIRATEKVPCYNDINFSSSPGNIYVDDDCTITALYSNGKVQCKCPWSDGTTKTVYVDSLVFFVSTPTPVKMTAPKYAVTYLRSTDTSTSWGWIDPGDTIYKLGTSGNMTQIIYPASNGNHRCAWVYTSEITETYTITYNANGGTGAPGNQTKTYNINLTLSSTIPKWEGHSFLGWSTSSSPTSVQYGAGGVYTVNAGATLYAVWKANQYNISYDANGGTGAPSPQTKTHGTALTLSSTEPTRTGYTFLGWALSETATSATYAAGGSYTFDGAATLYAVWKANTYTVQYDANGGVAAPSAQIKTHDLALKITADVPSRDGYSFVGWSEDKGTGTATYKPGEMFYSDENTVLFAVWEENIPTYIAGDINGDGNVNNKDLTRLMKYLAGEDVEVVTDALDVNDDGSVNNKDLTRLMKYLAGEDVEIH